MKKSTAIFLIPAIIIGIGCIICILYILYDNYLLIGIEGTFYVLYALWVEHSLLAIFIIILTLWLFIWSCIELNE